MAGIRKSANRPKPSKHMKGSSTRKKFKNDDPEALKNYQSKLASRAQRKLKKMKKGK